MQFAFLRINFRCDDYTVIEEIDHNISINAIDPDW